MLLLLSLLYKFIKFLRLNPDLFFYISVISSDLSLGVTIQKRAEVYVSLTTSTLITPILFEL